MTLERVLEIINGEFNEYSNTPHTKATELNTIAKLQNKIYLEITKEITDKLKEGEK